MPQPDDVIQNLMRQLGHTEEDELDCDEVYQLMDEYAEIVARGKSPDELLPKVRQHLAICGCCHEEIDALIQILESESATSD